MGRINPRGAEFGGRFSLPETGMPRLRGLRTADLGPNSPQIEPLGLAPAGRDRTLRLVQDTLREATKTPETESEYKPTLFTGIRDMQQYAMDTYGVLPVLVGGSWVRLLRKGTERENGTEIVGYDKETHTLIVRNLNLDYGTTRQEEGNTTRVDFDAMCFPVNKNGDSVQVKPYEEGKKVQLSGIVARLIDEYADKEDYPRAGFEEVYYVDPAERLRGFDRLRSRLKPHMVQINSNTEIFPPNSEIPGERRKRKPLEAVAPADPRGRIVYQMGLTLRQEVGWDSHEIVRIVVEDHPELGAIYAFNPRALKKRYEGTRNVGIIKPSDRKKIRPDEPISKIAEAFDLLDQPGPTKYQGWDIYNHRLHWSRNIWLHIKQVGYWLYWKYGGKKVAHSEKTASLDKGFSYHPPL